MEGWASSTAATLPGAPHGPWLCGGTWSGMYREPGSLPHTLHAVPYYVTLCHAMLCRVVPCHAMPHRTMPCWLPLQAGRGPPRASLAEGAGPLSCGRGPSPCTGTGRAVRPRSSSARGMIDLVSASGGLSRCQASAQTGALKGESPFPLRKAEWQSPRCRLPPQPRPRSHILGIIGPAAAGSGERLGGCGEHAGVWGPGFTRLSLLGLCLGSSRAKGGCGDGWRGEGAGHGLPLAAAPCSRLPRPFSLGCGSSSCEQRTFWGGEQGGL